MSQPSSEREVIYHLTEKQAQALIASAIAQDRATRPTHPGNDPLPTTDLSLPPQDNDTAETKEDYNWTPRARKQPRRGDKPKTKKEKVPQHRKTATAPVKPQSKEVKIEESTKVLSEAEALELKAAGVVYNYLDDLADVDRLYACHDAVKEQMAVYDRRHAKLWDDFLGGLPPAEPPTPHKMQTGFHSTTSKFYDEWRTNHCDDVG